MLDLGRREGRERLRGKVCVDQELREGRGAADGADHVPDGPGLQLNQGLGPHTADFGQPSQVGPQPRERQAGRPREVAGLARDLVHADHGHAEDPGPVQFLGHDRRGGPALHGAGAGRPRHPQPEEGRELRLRDVALDRERGDAVVNEVVVQFRDEVVAHRPGERAGDLDGLGREPLDHHAPLVHGRDEDVGQFVRVARDLLEVLVQVVGSRPGGQVLRRGVPGLHQGLDEFEGEQPRVVANLAQPLVGEGRDGRVHGGLVLGAIMGGKGGKVKEKPET